MFRKRGFTLLELIVVVIVIGILASIALPRFLRVAEKARTAEARSSLGAIRGAQFRYQAQWGNFTNNINVLDFGVDTKYFTIIAYDGNVPGFEGIVAVAVRNTSQEYSLSENPSGYSLGITDMGIFNITQNNPSEPSVNWLL